MTFSGRAENQNIKTTAISAILIFNSATGGHFSNVNTVLTSLATWSKKYHTDFFQKWSNNKNIRGNMQGGLICHAKSSIPMR